MYLIKPYVESQISDNSIKHLAECARVCYASESKGEESDKKLVDALRKNKHLSMFRHSTHYYIINKQDNRKIYDKLRYYKHCPYIKFITNNSKVYVALNGQFKLENSELINMLEDYEVFYTDFLTDASNLIRISFTVITQISTSRELNRVSPNNIAEQSTRYVNFGKKKGITICLPHWWDEASIFKKLLFKTYWKICELMYMLLLKLNFKPQDARGVLPLDTATKVVYTYDVDEWKHILDLRYFGITGSPHPNAKLVASEIFKDLSDMEFIYNNLL